MYLSVPAFVVLNLTIIVALMQWMLAPLFRLPRVRWADHVFMDRGRIANLYWLDRLNCQFCGYANGLCTMLNAQLDHLAALPPQQGGRWLLAAPLAVATLPLWVAFELYTVRFLYDLIISRCLRMARFSRAEGAALMEGAGYAAGLPTPVRVVLRAWKNSALALSMLLEQIESAWCPLRHYERREGIVYPEHHRNFFGADCLDDLRAARNALYANGGSVSPRSPVISAETS